MYLFVYLCFALFIASLCAAIYGLMHHSLIFEVGAIAFGILSYIAVALENANK